jgi:hypothetical protein
MKLDRKEILSFRNNYYSWRRKNMVSGAIANVLTLEMR